MQKQTINPKVQHFLEVEANNKKKKENKSKEKHDMHQKSLLPWNVAATGTSTVINAASLTG